MKTLIALLVLCAGCTTINYTSPFGDKFSRTAFGLNINVSTLDVEMDTNGIRRVTLKGYRSASEAFVEAATEGAARGAASAFKP